MLIAIITLAFTPVASFALEADGSLVPCGKSTTSAFTTNTATGEREELLFEECTFDHVMELVNNVVNFVLFKMAVPIAAIMFAYAGFLMITAGGESAQSRGKAKTIFTNVAIGLVIAVGAWLIVHTLLNILGFDGAWLGF